MVNLIKSDLYRIFRGKAIYITFIVIIILAVVSVVGISAGHIGLSTSSNIDISNTEMIQKLSNANSLGEVRDVMKSFGTFALDKDIIGQNINLYYLFIVITVIVVATDFSNKSVKNTLSSAITREKYYLSKLILIILLSTLLIFFNNYLSYFLNLVVNGKDFSSPILEITKITFIQLPLLYGIISLLVCFAFIFRKTSLFNTISIPFIMVVQLVVMGVTNLFKLKADWFYDYEAQFALNNLVNDATTRYTISCILLGIAYIVVFNIIGYYSFKKIEIK